MGIPKRGDRQLQRLLVLTVGHQERALDGYVGQSHRRRLWLVILTVAVSIFGLVAAPKVPPATLSADAEPDHGQAAQSLAQEKDKMQLAKERLELVSGWVYLIGTVVFPVATLILAVVGVRLAIPVTTGGCGLASGIAAFLERRAARQKGLDRLDS
jgi:hypothetical protein